MADADAYGTFNMGAGFALFVDGGAVDQALDAARAAGFDLLHAGTVEPGPRRVVINPLGIAFEGASLRVR
jgi:phosphoribosylformylglycinamidine cyclo-ligase